MIASINGKAVTLGIWGAEASGKTTFLRSIRVAALRAENGRWLVDGEDADSIDFLAQGTIDSVAVELPPTPATTAETNYRFRILGDHLVAGPSFVRSLQRAVLNVLGQPTIEQFRVMVQDRRGGATDDRNSDSPEWESAAQYLAGADGLLFLLDLVDEVGLSDHGADLALQQVQKLIDRMRNLRRETGGLTNDERLPQYVAVCITKSDRADISERLASFGIVGATGARDAPPDSVALAFAALAGPLVANQLINSFEPGRVRCFVTSALGYSRSTEQPTLSDGKYAPHTARQPINVLEPLVWLYRSTRRR